MTAEQLKEVYLDQKTSFVKKDKLIDRTIDLAKYINTSQIVVITGVRRSGKSSLLYLISKKMGLKEKDYCYLNLDDERIPQDLSVFEEIYSLHRRMYQNEPVFFFDEVQNIKGWERFVNRLYEKGAKVFVTGSNATLLSSEISSSLTGRNKTLELLPFSFEEYLRFKKVNLDVNRLDSDAKALLLAHFDSFIKTGGFPLVIRENDTELLDTYFKDILYRDIVARYRITQVEEIKQIGTYFAANVAKLFSISTLQKITGIKSTASINDYLHYYAQSFLYYFIRKFDYSVKKQILNPRKVYAVDHGLANRIGFSFSKNKGRLLENIVFLQLVRQNAEIFYFSRKKECDFVIKQGVDITGAIQVCYALNHDNYEREVNGLLEAVNEFHLSRGLLLVYESEIKQEDLPQNIQLINVWRWLMKNEK
jgi:predicted AAA+ superfamily ATPase